MSGFSVEPERLERFAATSDDRGSTLTGVRGTMAEVRLAPDAFGHIPFLGSTVYDAYDEHVAGCEEAVAEAAEAMSAVAEGLRAVVVAYQEGDRAAGEDAAALQQALDGVRFIEGGQ